MGSRLLEFSKDGKEFTNKITLSIFIK